MKIIECPLCSEKKYNVLYRSTLTAHDTNTNKISQSLLNTLDKSQKHGQYVKCESCSLVYVNPPEDLRLLIAGYKNVVDKTYLSTEKYRKKLSQSHLSKIMKYKKGNSILDVGCFAGFFLELAKQSGWKIVHGIEPSTWAKMIAKGRGIEIVGETIQSAKLKKSFYDVITLWDVIEHLPNPDETIDILKTSLKKNGIIAIGTPDIESPIAKILKERYPYLVRMHIILYSRKTLRYLLEKHGFRVLYTKSYGRTFPVSYIIDRIPFNDGLFGEIKKRLTSIKILQKLSFTLNIGDSFIMIAQRK
ncbi:MAG: class I SAM-dependent methyltransferase [Candidatus Levybacteria bacterium]|nr:class I SAM-dependent methyltransferase [Candidatus Levybacteria bacterium]